MRTFATLFCTLSILVGTALALPTAALASNEIAEVEGLACTTCHDKPGSKLLTDKGKYYELASTLHGYAELETAFGRCTSCHVRKPGSLKLTKKGRHFQSLLDDMDGLRELLIGHHPESFGADPHAGSPDEVVDEASDLPSAAAAEASSTGDSTR